MNCYSIDPYWLKERIKEEKWKRKGKTEEYQVAFFRRGAVHTIRVADYEDYILITILLHFLYLGMVIFFLKVHRK